MAVKHSFARWQTGTALQPHLRLKSSFNYVAVLVCLTFLQKNEIGPTTRANNCQAPVAKVTRASNSLLERELKRSRLYALQVTAPPGRKWLALMKRISDTSTKFGGARAPLLALFQVALRARKESPHAESPQAAPVKHQLVVGQNFVTSVKLKPATFMAGTTLAAPSSPAARTAGPSAKTLLSSSWMLTLKRKFLIG